MFDLPVDGAGSADQATGGAPDNSSGAPPSPFAASPMMSRFMGASPSQAPQVAKPPTPKEVELLTKLAALPNAAVDEHFDDDMLQRIGSQAHDGFGRDLASRGEWEEIAERAMATAEQARQGKNYPFPNASNVRYPLIAIAALQFNARAYPAICTGRDVVKAKIGGADPQGQKAARASRVSQFQSHQIVDGIPSWEFEMDTLCYQLPIIGSAFKKSYWDPEKNQPDSKLISAFDLIVNQSTRSLETCPRISHRFELYPYQIDERQRGKQWLDVDLSDEYGGDESDQEPIWFVEQHLYYDVDGDGYAEPWIVTFSLQGQKVVRIVAGFEPLDIVHDGDQIVRIPRDEYFTAFAFLPNPKGGFYGIGFGHLLDSFGEVINTSFNLMLDAGHLQTAGGGFMGAGLDLQSDGEEFRFEPGKYYTATSESTDIRNSIVNLEHPGPSPVLFQLLGMMMDDAKQMTSIQDILTGSAATNTMQPTTLMAMIDQGMKVFTAIYKRIYNALSGEFRIMYRLNRKYLQDEEYSEYMGEQASVQADFADDKCLVAPVADPNSVTMMQKMAKAGFLQTLASDATFGPMLNKQPILMQILNAACIDNVNEILAPPQPANPLQVQAELAAVDKTKSEAAHNYALAQAETSRGENYRAKTADTMMGHQPDFYTNPGPQQNQ